MGRFGDNPIDFFKTVYEHEAPWEIGGAQPALLAMLDELPAVDPILDVGCGAGDTTLALAARGHTVVGVDFVPQAIDQARAKVLSCGDPELVSRIELVVGDGLEPGRLNRVFGSVVDSGFLHLWDEDQRLRYWDRLQAVLVPGGRAYFIEFGVDFNLPNTPVAITEDWVRSALQRSPGWRLAYWKSAQFENRVAPVPAVVFCLEKHETR